MLITKDEFDSCFGANMLVHPLLRTDEHIKDEHAPHVQSFYFLLTDALLWTKRDILIHHHYVLCFSCRERHWILFLAHPRDKIITKVEATSWSTLSIVHTTSPVYIWIPSKASIWVFWIPQTIVWSSIDVSYNTLHYNQVWFLWSSLISSTNTNAECNIWSTSCKIE